MTSSNLPYWLATLYLPNVGPRKMLQWLQSFASIVDFFQASEQALITAGVPAKYHQAILRPDWSAVENDLAWEAQCPHHHLMTIDDVDYPSLLKEIPDPPLVLYIQGNKQLLNKKQLAMVGSRSATPTGIKNAEQFAHHLAGMGMVITSGLALGIDAASHRGALAAKGETIAVAGTGLSQVYPPSHQTLAEQIIQEKGVVMSEFSLTSQPHASHFPRRNRIISGLSLGVLVVEAALKSGSLITARQAIEQNREVFAIPGSIHNPQARGCHHLIKQGAKLVEKAADILEELGLAGQFTLPNLSHSPEQMSAKADRACRKLLAHIEYETTSIDTLLSRSGLTAGEVSSILLRLELLGCIQSVPGGFINVVTNE